ncbi:MAG: sigma-70 family RNA polymerase sigma factor [Xanthomonadales bacterium]|nr:sigma-70 family RNA polymerase sigma factor [Xanthomonadales bacterium]
MTSGAVADRQLPALADALGVSAEQLLPALYDSLRRTAHRLLQGERPGHTLNTTALVHESWVRLTSSYPDLQFQTDHEFLALSGSLMRRVLIDHARFRHRLKRGGGERELSFSDELETSPLSIDQEDLLALDLALTRLQQLDPRQVQIVELRYFAGFSISETAELLQLSTATIKREWVMARAWLLSHLHDADQ